MLAREFGVKLAKRHKQQRQVFVTNAHAGVLHLDAHRRYRVGALCRQVVVHPPGLQVHPAFVGELDGIAQQVEQHLLHPACIAVHGAQVCRDVYLQLQVFFVRQWFNDGGHLAD